ncbi:MAG: DUF1275 domain-containing protein [Pseudonocardia sp.]|nr:DUF1275 domain-containing protein [Pseudonocardia sp.]
MAVTSPASRRWTVAALLTLTATTGLVDAVSFLRLGRVFAANMTGNVVFLGFGVVASSDVDVLASALAIAAFVAGAVAGGRVGRPDLTTTVLTMTLTGLSSDSVLAGGPGGRPQRRFGSVLAMFGGAATGALLLQITFAGTLGLAAAAVGAVALVFARRAGSGGAGRPAAASTSG